jgi:hypothetical protein
MKIRDPWMLATPLIAGAAGITSVVLIPATSWDTSRAAVVACISVIAAGTLVRLARGMPFTNADQFEVNEIRKLSEGAKLSVRALGTLLTVAVVAMVVVCFSTQILTNQAAPVASFINGFLLGYSLARVINVVRSDIQLTDLQATYMVRSVERKVAARNDSLGSMIPNVETPEGYGRVLQ